MAKLFVVFLVCAPVHAATHVWISADGYFGAASSWNTGKAPSEWLPTDNVLFSGTIQMDAQSGLDQTGVRVASILVHEDYGGDIGASGNPLIIAADVVTFRGYGAFVFKGQPTPGTMNFTFLDGYTTGTQIVGDHDWLIIKSGWIDVLQSARIDTLFIDQGSQGFSNPDVTIHQGEPIRYLVAGGDLVINKRNVGAGCVLKVERGSVVQEGVMENGAHLDVQGGYFIYDPSQEPPTPGPTAEFQYGTCDFTQTFYDVHFAFGMASYSANFQTIQPLPLMGIVDLYSVQPSVSFVDRADDDGDGICNVFDHCIGDTDGDCKITLKDFATMQNDMSGP